jgi:hypothetical protein
MSATITAWIACGNCDRGGRGNAKDKCACGWKTTEANHLGCYLGTPIVGNPVRPPKLSQSKRRYQYYLSVADVYDSFGDFLRDERTRKGRP